MYDYKEEKKRIITEDGFKLLLIIKDRVDSLLEKSGSFKLCKAIGGLSGDNWQHMACIDYLEELGQIQEVTNPRKVRAQDRIFVRRI